MTLSELATRHRIASTPKLTADAAVDVVICPACEGPLSFRDGGEDSSISCRCTVVSLEWINLAAALTSGGEHAGS